MWVEDKLPPVHKIGGRCRPIWSPRCGPIARVPVSPRKKPSILGWTAIIEAMKPDLVFRIEDGQHDLWAFLRDHDLVSASAMPPVDTAPVNSDKLYLGVRYPKPDIAADDWRALPGDLVAGVRAYCERYGYSSPV